MNVATRNNILMKLATSKWGANPSTIRTTALALSYSTAEFHLKNKEVNRSMKVVWNKKELENTTHPKYLGVILNSSLSYKQHIPITNIKVATSNNLLTKLATSKWGANPSSIRTTALALSYSSAEYTTPVWARSAHAKNLDPELNLACRSVT